MNELYNAQDSHVKLAEHIPLQLNIKI